MSDDGNRLKSTRAEGGSQIDAALDTASGFLSGAVKAAHPNLIGPQDMVERVQDRPEKRAFHRTYTKSAQRAPAVQGADQ